MDWLRQLAWSFFALPAAWAWLLSPQTHRCRSTVCYQPTSFHWQLPLQHVPLASRRRRPCLGTGFFDNLPNLFQNKEGGSSALDRATSIFDESTALGKGVTVVRIQVGLDCADRDGRSSILRSLAEKAGTCDTGTPKGLAALVGDVCLALLRRSDDWVSACTETTNFVGSRFEDKAEAFYNREVTKQLAKFEKEYVPESNQVAAGPSTLVVVTLLAAIRGDQTNFGSVDGSKKKLRQALTRLASDAAIQRGDLLVAAEVLWTPTDSSEVLTQQDLVLDYPELLEL